MPPGPAYNWFCVAHSLYDILSHAAHIRAVQVTRTGRVLRASGPLSNAKAHAEEAHNPPLAEDGTPAAVAATNAMKVAQSVPKLSTAYGDPAESQRRNADSSLHEQNEDRSSLAPSKHSPETTLRTVPLPKHPHPLPVQAEPIPQVSQLKPIADATTTPQSNHSQANLIQAEPTSRLSQSTSFSSSTSVTSAQGVPPSKGATLDRIETLHPDIPSVGDFSATTGIPGPAEPIVFEKPSSRNLQSSKVPSSRIGRLFHYGGLAASLGYGAASELLRRSTTNSDEHAPPSLMLTEGNIKRLVSKLSQMRGAALKLGQFMSIQDSHVLPPEIEDIFRRVQDSAHYMPDWQMEQVMRESLGPSWMDNFESFERLPFAAASIGQVHSAVLAAPASPTGTPARVAVKIQFPNIVNSINSDLGYVKMLLTASKLLPRGLFLDRTIQVMKEELADECDYAREASFLRRFGQSDHLGADDRFKIPWVWEGSTDRVLVMEHVDGVSVGGTVIDRLMQRDRDDIAARIVDLCLRELFVFRVMQTDPNWTNFLWNPRTRKVELVDFGATREYSKEFIDNWLHLLSAAVSEDRDACIHWSLKLGYLTGEENEIMLDAHVKSMILLGTPFNPKTPQPFKFGPGSDWAHITAEIRDQIPVMLKHRLTPPPRETYSLNRKLSGAFLLASRLGASVDCRTLWEKVVQGYRYD